MPAVFRRLFLRFRDNANHIPVAPFTELYFSGYCREYRMVFTYSDIFTGIEIGTVLAYDYRSGFD
jgi:hypothetical protein